MTHTRELGFAAEMLMPREEFRKSAIGQLEAYRKRGLSLTTTVPALRPV
ncbi:MAG: hypothetical protein HDT15_09395 [Oscillibacter sp.]|nr:hypothetical protein [Oscillibacter sp.]